MLTGHDIAQALLDLIAANADALNADPLLSGAYWKFSTAAEDAEGSTDAYKFLKVEDREVVPDGLTVCCSPGGDRDKQRYTQWLVTKEATVYVIAYLAGSPTGDGKVDQALLRGARHGVTRALTGLFNATANQTSIPIAGDAHGAFGGRVSSADYGNAPKLEMGAFVPFLMLTWKGQFSVQET